ncbi:gamma-glutamyltransferase [Chloracidobacterium validum]|uniref:Glutathione hydrolase proenzyme n=2 Tax=Chloracidobacterium validum TaxID=2821543 RepID=A0ABX8BCX0_9BACT|nr:gamma-glutamyltransferase [Chloracidobacterium validum]
MSLACLVLAVAGGPAGSRSAAPAAGATTGNHAASDRITGRTFATRSEVIARNGMACTSQPLATQVAVDVLRRGGSAVDAAIAANAVLGVVEPTGCGIGGDLFALVWDPKTKRLHGLNASGRSPKRLTLDVFRQRNLTRIPAYGPLPVSVPGCVDGWFELHGRFGRLPMKEILAPAVAYAREGFPVSELIAYYLERNVTALARFPNVMAVYAPGGRPPRKGEVFRNPQLAATLEKIAAGGRDVFYKGDIARAIADFMAKQGGFLDADDLAAHRSTWVEPISTNYRGYDVWELPPNGQGLAALQMLNILEGYDLSKFGFGSREHIHYFVEAKKLAFEDRAKFYADPDFAKVPVEALLSKAYAAERRKLIQPDRAGARYAAGEPALRAGDTIYLTTADRDGMMVSLIQSNYRGMGSGMVPDGLGFMLQDRGEMFALEEGHANVYAPGKRPFHTIIPAFVTKDGQPWMSFGVMGGGFQPLGHVQILVNLIDFGMNLQEAGDAPRIDHQGSSEPTGERASGVGTVTLETGFAYEVVRELVRTGHRVGFAVGDYGGYQAIRWDAGQGVYYGASESRKDGQAAGY